jgi:membrane protease YdiL (CAAX protease family)
MPAAGRWTRKGAAVPNPATAARIEALALAAALIGYSNGLALWTMRQGRAADEGYRGGNLPFLALLVGAVAAWRGVGPRVVLREAGMRRPGGRDLLGGLLLGGLLALPGMIFFARPVVLREPLHYDPIAGMSAGAFRRRIWLELPLLVALFEELAFRGLLHEAWRRAGWARGAGAATTATFAAWHWAVTVDTMRRTNIAAEVTRVPRLLRRHANAVGVAGGLAATAVAGGAFTALRAGTGGRMAGPILAHWIADALLVAALHRQNSKRWDQ